MDQHEHHQTILNGFHEQIASILEQSEQAMYVFLDEEHKFCNEKFAALLGYGSAEEWAKTNGSFTQLFVDEMSQGTLVGAYKNAMNKCVGSTVQVAWKHTSGKPVQSTVMLVPVAFQGRLMALHYISA